MMIIIITAIISPGDTPSLNKKQAYDDNLNITCLYLIKTFVSNFMKTPCLERPVDQHGNGRCSVKVRLAVHHDDVNRLFQAVHNDLLANGQSHATKHWWHGIGVKQGFDTLIKLDPSLLLKTLAKSPSNGRVCRSPTAGADPCHRCASTAGRTPGSCAQSPGQL